MADIEYGWDIAGRIYLWNRVCLVCGNHSTCERFAISSDYITVWLYGIFEIAHKITAPADTSKQYIHAGSPASGLP